MHHQNNDIKILLCSGCLFIIGNQTVSRCECNLYYFDNALNVSFCDCVAGKQCWCCCIHKSHGRTNRHGGKLTTSTFPAKNDGEEGNEKITKDEYIYSVGYF